MGTYTSVAVTGGGTACILFGLFGGTARDRLRGQLWADHAGSRRQRLSLAAQGGGLRADCSIALRGQLSGRSLGASPSGVGLVPPAPHFLGGRRWSARAHTSGMEDGWRYLYGLASLQLLFLVPLWRLLPANTKGSKEGPNGLDSEGLKQEALMRLSWQRRMTLAVRSGIRPLRLLATSYPKRAAACLFVNANNGFAFTPSAVLKIKHLQDVHGLSPKTVSVVVITSGLVALVVFPLLGRLSCCVTGGQLRARSTEGRTRDQGVGKRVSQALQRGGGRPQTCCRIQP